MFFFQSIRSVCCCDDHRVLGARDRRDGRKCRQSTKRGRGKGETTRRRQLQGGAKLKGESCVNAFLRCCADVYMHEQEESEHEKMHEGDVHIIIMPTNLLEVRPLKTVCCQQRSLSAACNLLRGGAEDHWVHFDHAPSLLPNEVCPIRSHEPRL